MGPAQPESGTSDAEEKVERGQGPGRYVVTRLGVEPRTPGLKERFDELMPEKDEVGWMTILICKSRG
jgi:hypothetical protein